MHEPTDNTSETENTSDRMPDTLERTQLTKFQIIATCIGILLTIVLSLYAIITFISIPTNPSPTATPAPSNDPEIYVTPAPTENPDGRPGPTTSPSTSPSPTPIVKTVTKTGGQNGSVTDSGLVTAQSSIDVGRSSTQIYRGFVGFDIAEIPAAAQISKATLRLYQRTVSGTPYSVLGNIEIDHLDYGATLTAESYNGGNVYATYFGIMASNPLTEWKSLDVTEQVKKDRAIHTSSQFRLHFSSETKGGSDTGDIASFSNTNTVNEAPQLVIEYY
jgi:hypothetical protein